MAFVVVLGFWFARAGLPPTRANRDSAISPVERTIERTRGDCAPTAVRAFVDHLIRVRPRTRAGDRALQELGEQLPLDHNSRSFLLESIQLCDDFETLFCLLDLAVRHKLPTDGVILEHALRLSEFSEPNQFAHYFAILILRHVKEEDLRIGRLLALARFTALDRGDARMGEFVENAILARLCAAPLVLESLKRSLAQAPTESTLFVVRSLGAKAAEFEPVLRRILDSDPCLELLPETSAAYAALAVGSRQWETIVQRLLEHADYRVRAQVSEALRNTGLLDAGAKLLAKGLSDSNAQVRANTFDIFWRCGVKDTELAARIHAEAAADQPPRRANGGGSMFAVSRFCKSVIAAPRASSDVAEALRAVTPGIPDYWDRARVAIACWSSGGDVFWVARTLVESLPELPSNPNYLRDAVNVLAKISAGLDPVHPTFPPRREQGRRVVTAALAKRPELVPALRWMRSREIDGAAALLELVSK